MSARSYRQFCALARALDAVGDRWSMLIVRNLLLGPQRWSDLRGTLPGIARNLLSGRLADLITEGIVERVDDRYALTARGQALQPALFALAEWGEAHFMGPPGEEDAFRVRYLMTSLRRKLRPSALEGRLQLWVDEAPYSIRLGSEPAVEQGLADVPADAEVRCGGLGLRALLFGGAPVSELVAAGTVQVTGDAALVQAFARHWRG